MLTKLASGQRGVTLLELIITVSIMGILMAIGVPQLGEWIRKTSVSSGAEVLQNGLRRAEAEAIRRNAFVEFFLTNGTPKATGIAKLAAISDGANWAVRTLDSSYTPLSDETAAYVTGQEMKEVSNELTVEGPASLVFNGNGRVGSKTGVAITEPQIYRISRAGTGAICVFVTVGGSVKACNPALESGKPFACQPQISAEQCKS